MDRGCPGGNTRATEPTATASTCDPDQAQSAHECPAFRSFVPQPEDRGPTLHSRLRRVNVGQMSRSTRPIQQPVGYSPLVSTHHRWRPCSLAAAIRPTGTSRTQGMIVGGAIGAAAIPRQCCAANAPGFAGTPRAPLAEVGRSPRTLNGGWRKRRKRPCCCSTRQHCLRSIGEAK
jgi:hypothetical protein